MPSSDRASLRVALRSRAVLAVVVLAFVVGLLARVYHLGTSPRPLQTADEYAWTWAGMSLLHDGVPASWSFLPAYAGGVQRTFGGQKFTIVSPWLDHPPLFAVVAGAWARLGGFRDPYAVDLSWMRLLPLLLWMAAFVLLATVLARHFDAATLCAALMAWSLAPPMVLQSKLVVSENLVVPLFLAAYLVLLRAHERPSWRALAALAALTLALPLIKVPALAFCLILALHAIGLGDRRLAAVVALATVAGVGLYLAYGAHFGWEQFRAVQLAHRGRFVGFRSGLSLMFGTRIVDESVVWPLWYVGVLGVVVDVVQRRGRDLALQALVYVGCMSALADERSVYGWYWIPLYPAMAAGIGSFVVRTWRADDGAYVALLAVITAPWLFSVGMEIDWDSRQELRAAFVAILAVVVAVVALMRGPRRTSALRGLTVLFVTMELGGDVVWLCRR